MYTDIPQFARCCFCAPLRVGLMAWGYIKLILLFVLWIVIADGIVHTINRNSDIPIGFILFILAAVIDEVFTVMLVIAAHKKNEKLFHIYYIYTIVYLVVLGICCGLHLILMFLATLSYPHPYLLKFLIMIFVSTVALLLIQGYIILLVRSELLKLRDRNNIQFVNQAGEAQCNAYMEKV